MEGYALHDDEMHRLQRAGAAAVTGGGASADAGAGGRPKHESTLTLAGLSEQLHVLARSHEASLGRLDGMAEAQAVLLREVRSAAAGVHELQVQQRSLAERLELPTGAAVAVAGSDAEVSVAAAQEATASSSEQLREQTAELWMLQQALRAELQRRPDTETVDALLARKLDRAGGEVAAHGTSHMPHVRMHLAHAFYDACTRTHTHAGRHGLSTPGEAARARGLPRRHRGEAGGGGGGRRGDAPRAPRAAPLGAWQPGSIRCAASSTTSTTNKTLP